MSPDVAQLQLQAVPHPTWPIVKDGTNGSSSTAGYHNFPHSCRVFSLISSDNK